MNDMRVTIIPKSDQINADDLIGRDLTIRITRVSLTVEADQPVSLNFEGDNGKPYKPCKSMRRVLVNVWGPDGNVYVGRSLTLYRDDKVQFGGMAVGGIRISHMSDIDAPVTMALTATRANRKPFTVKPLKLADAPPPTDKTTLAAEALIKHFQDAEDAAGVMAIIDDPDARKRRDWLREKRPELSARVEAAASAAFERHVRPTQTAEDDGDVGFAAEGVG